MFVYGLLVKLAGVKRDEEVDGLTAKRDKNFTFQARSLLAFLGLRVIVVDSFGVSVRRAKHASLMRSEKERENAPSLVILMSF
jgi:hypothetical protein